MAQFIEVMGPGPSKFTINVSQITSIKASVSGCTIRLVGDHSVQTKTPYKDIKAAIEEAVSAHTQIYTTIVGDVKDATPPPQIEIR